MTALQGLYLALFIVYFVLVLVQVRVVMYKMQRGALNHVCTTGYFLSLLLLTFYFYFYF